MGPIGFWWYWIMRDPSHLRKQHRNIALFLCFPCFLRETFFHVNMFDLFIYLVIQCMLFTLFIHKISCNSYIHIYNLRVCVCLFVFMLRQKRFLFIYHVSTYLLYSTGMKHLFGCLLQKNNTSWEQLRVATCCFLFPCGQSIIGIHLGESGGNMMEYVFVG